MLFYLTIYAAIGVFFMPSAICELFEHVVDSDDADGSREEIRRQAWNLGRKLPQAIAIVYFVLAASAVAIVAWPMLVWNKAAEISYWIEVFKEEVR